MPRPASADVKSPFAASAVSGHLDTRTAATEIANALFDEFGSASPGGACDLALLFGSFHHRSAFDDAADIIRKTISPITLLGVTAESVLGNDVEFEGLAGMSALALRLPGVRVHPWHSTPDDPIPLSNPSSLRDRLGANADNAHTLRAALMFADPFTTPIARLLPAINEAFSDPNAAGNNDAGPQSSIAHRQSSIPIIGGLASGASQPGLNVLVLNDRAASVGVVGVSLFGDLDLDFVVSQGCRPIGAPLIITKAKDNIVLELGGRKAIHVLHELATSLSEADKRLLSRGLLVGTVIDEYKGHFGRGDFLIRNVLGLDQKVGGIAIGEMCRIGQTIQFHVRDAATADEDLQLLLDAQAMAEPPLAALLFTCNGRGQRLFNEPNHDTGVIRQRLGSTPLAGFFAAGEIGPIGSRSFLHGHTASLAVLRAGANTALTG